MFCSAEHLAAPIRRDFHGVFVTLGLKASETKLSSTPKAFAISVHESTRTLLTGNIIATSLPP